MKKTFAIIAYGLIFALHFVHADNEPTDHPSESPEVNPPPMLLNSSRPKGKTPISASTKAEKPLEQKKKMDAPLKKVEVHQVGMANQYVPLTAIDQVKLEAKLLSENPQMTPEQIQNAIVEKVRRTAALTCSLHGCKKFFSVRIQAISGVYGNNEGYAILDPETGAMKGMKHDFTAVRSPSGKVYHDLQFNELLCQECPKVAKVKMVKNDAITKNADPSKASQMLDLMKKAFSGAKLTPTSKEDSTSKSSQVDKFVPESPQAGPGAKIFAEPASVQAGH
jgi:hypothetical protein